MRKTTLGITLGALLVFAGAALAASPVTIYNQTTNPLGNTQDTPIGTSNPLPVQIVPPVTTSPGTFTSGVAANSNNATNLKATPGTVFSLEAYNNSASPVYLKLYDKATAPSCGTDTPVERHMIPATGGFIAERISAKAYAVGIGFCIVTGIADSDNTSASASTVLFNIGWR